MTSNTTKMLNLMSLPKDGLALIISFIQLKCDLRHVYRTCKALHCVAIAPLYHHITIRENHNRTKLTTAFTPENPGLQHVRHLTILDGNGKYRRASTSLDYVLLLVGNLLPRDVLLTFT